MNSRHCLKIATHINTMLVRQLDAGIEPERMVADALYARDVLLVCDGLRSDDTAAALAQAFRAAALAEPEKETLGSAASRFLSSFFGGQPTAEGLREPPRARAPKRTARARMSMKPKR